MSRPLVTDQDIANLAFARACILDQQDASHALGHRQYDAAYSGALSAIALITLGHKRSKRDRKSRRSKP